MVTYPSTQGRFIEVDAMWTIEVVPRRTRNFPPARWSWVLLLCASFVLDSMHAQSTNSVSGGGSSGASGFSIETEMLTYRALESDSEAVACDVAAYLNGTSANFASPPAGSVCDVKSGSARTTVVVLPFDRSELGDFQLWRADMLTISDLRRRAATLNCPAKSAGRGASALDAALASTPVGPPLALAQDLLSMLVTDEAVSSVGGNIQDVTFADGVGRQLRALNVSVLMPSSYGPYTLATVDEAKSPLLSAINKLMDARSCLAAKDDAKNKDSIAQTVQYIDAFLATLNGGTATPAAPAAADSKKPPVSAPAAAAPPSGSHLLAVLSADGLAQQLGVNPITGALPGNGASVHILLLKALESGGTVAKTTNVLGGKIRYSGGAVGTYALFHVDGSLECSGNVYDYAGSIPAKDFEKLVGGYPVDASRQMIFQRGSCSVPAQDR